MGNTTATISIQNVRDDRQTPFGYLKIANEYLSSPESATTGREYIIRALANMELFKQHNQLLKNLVRKAGLYPYLKKFFKDDNSEELNFLLSLFQSEASMNFVFHSMQAKIFRLLMSGKNVVLSAPTSMGKSAIVDSLVATDKFKRVVIVVPTIALIDETRRRIQKLFGQKFQVIFHGTQACNRSRAIYVLTQERVNERHDLKNIDLFIIDEFYKLAFSQEDESRVVALNIALSKLLVCSKQFYMIGPYIDAVRGMEGIGKDYVFVPTDFNTVALNIHEYNLPPNDLDSKNDKLREIIEAYGGPTIIYCKSQGSISRVVDGMANFQAGIATKEITDYQMWLENFYGEDWCYTKALELGVGIHHGALPRALQQRTIELFNSGSIKLLICTSTLIEGVNTAAENVIVYDNRRSNTSIDTFTYKNIAGRAGRMNQHLIGNVFCLEPTPKINEQSNVVDVPLGQQNDSTPVSLLAGMQNEHLSTAGTESLDRYAVAYDVPINLIKKHAAYSAQVINEAYQFVKNLSLNEKETLSRTKAPSSVQLNLLTKFIKIVELNSLRNLNLHFADNQDLHNRIGWYLYAKSHSEYLSERLTYIYQIHSDSHLRSDATDRELKIIRNIFKYAVPRALLLLQDLLSEENREIQSSDADFGYIMHIFENSHLPTSFSALEEMGIAIETLEKLVTDRLSHASIDTLVRYLRWFHKRLSNLSKVDKMFIEVALN
ncbi:DEAD/DEAH box helicase [Cellvibrio sp. NN19]|uniref:DEAD/DEAH box helicase n=1 Tax=Cellvibrio chitinivorans TaxID=3102792 RepID=UPI002B416FFC|nr:DEAD/DEAH box helicase [Cellvibrio sp. NN19]